MIINNCPYCGRDPYVYYNRCGKIHRFSISCINNKCKCLRICNGYGLTYDTAKQKACNIWDKYIDKVRRKNG